MTLPELTKVELTYTMRLVEDNHRSEGIRWSIRQSGIYQNLATWPRHSTWIFVALTTSLESALDRYVQQTVSDPGSNVFELHYVFLDAALSGWSDCITYVAEEVQKQVNYPYPQDT